MFRQGELHMRLKSAAGYDRFAEPDGGLKARYSGQVLWRFRGLFRGMRTSRVSGASVRACCRYLGSQSMGTGDMRPA